MLRGDQGDASKLSRAERRRLERENKKIDGKIEKTFPGLRLPPVVSFPPNESPLPLPPGLGELMHQYQDTHPSNIPEGDRLSIVSATAQMYVEDHPTSRFTPEKLTASVQFRPFTADDSNGLLSDDVNMSGHTNPITGIISINVNSMLFDRNRLKTHPNQIVREQPLSTSLVYDILHEFHHKDAVINSEPSSVINKYLQENAGSLSLIDVTGFCLDIHNPTGIILPYELLNTYLDETAVELSTLQTLKSRGIRAFSAYPHVSERIRDLDVAIKKAGISMQEFRDCYSRSDLAGFSQRLMHSIYGQQNTPEDEDLLMVSGLYALQLFQTGDKAFLDLLVNHKPI